MEMESCNTMSYNFSTQDARIHQNIKNFIYKYSAVFLKLLPRSFREDWLPRRVLYNIL